MLVIRFFVADLNTFPAFGWFDNLDDFARNPCPFQGNAEEQVSVLLSSLSVPTAESGLSVPFGAVPASVGEVSVSYVPESPAPEPP
eukprot:2892185-Pyramimonas_sp.AAC.1